MVELCARTSTGDGILQCMQFHTREKVSDCITQFYHLLYCESSNLYPITGKGCNVRLLETWLSYEFSALAELCATGIHTP